MCETASPGIFCHTEVHRLCLGAKSLRLLQSCKSALGKETVIHRPQVSPSRHFSHLPSSSEVKEVLGGLTALTPASARTEKDRHRVVVLLIEGVICDYVRKPGRGKELQFRPEAISALEYVKLSWQLVLVSAWPQGCIQEVVQILSGEGVEADAVYRINEAKATEWGLDYTQIYHDFRLGNSPKTQCLIVTALKADFSETNSLTSGRNLLRAHTVRLPVPCFEAPSPPVTVLLPHLALQDRGSASLVLLSLVLSTMSQSQGFEAGFRALSYEWAAKVTVFPYSKLWLGTYTAKEQARYIGNTAASDAASLLVLKGRHLKPNVSMFLRRPHTPAK